MTHRPPANEDVRLHPSAQMGMLNYLVANAIDADYEAVAKRQGVRTPGRGIAAGVVAAVFALLVLTAANQTSRNAGSEETDRAQLVGQLREGRARLDDDRAEVATLRRAVDRLRAQALNSSTLSRQTRDRLRLLGVETGTLPVQGEGIVITVDDAPDATQDSQMVLDVDLQRLVNGLWSAGAEAVSINGQRIGALSAIRQAGDAITVNFRSLQRPYRVTAIGSRARLPGRFAETSSGQAWLDLHRRVKLELAIRTGERLRVPGLPTPTLRHATVAKEKS